ncbi:MAG: hypothetical protein IV086_04835 [Hyphomonadaceae bacterium]|nr:MAG: hypothetical protein FD160_1620 [Caulobacteraceae bacterium]MBT9445006.1 hypothetical protein [Hyphomonadaceae bacterium]TPW04301.1 MAG: hypothetical protein FD124_2671 [Alphaproteobacteria bacterium]
MRALILLAAVSLALTACVKPGQGNAAGGRYVDPYTCEVRNPREGDQPYDADCIKAAQRTAEAAAKAASRKK